MIPKSHKTVFVLDRGPIFSKSSQEPLDYDVISKSKTPGVIPAAPIFKSLWTWGIECVLEYMRIIFDVFPANHLIQLVAGNHCLNSWQQKEQNILQIMQCLSQLGAPKSESAENEYSAMHGLSQAVESLCKPSELQTSVLEEEDNVRNTGRIICLTNLKSEAHIHVLEECVLDALTQHNKLAASTDSLIPIDHCELVLVHIVPVNEELKIVHKPYKEVSPYFSIEVQVTKSGRSLYNKLVHLAQIHYDLSSTTVTGIPMKEEQNASSSANYDVELLHSANAHRELISAAKAGYVEGLVVPSKEGLPTETVLLKWCTPKTNAVELHHCSGAYRITPVDVNSRPSSCLTNFLLGDRSVMLEQPRKTGGKVISHILASHGGEIFIHSLPTYRFQLEDPPSISEGCGGRVTDYRIPDFGIFMKENRLAPVTPTISEQYSTTAMERSLSVLERRSRYLPMVISDSILSSMISSIEPLPSLIVKESLGEEEVLECKKAILHVVEMETKSEPLIAASTGTRGKGPKRDEQYRQLWLELEQMVNPHSESSPGHAEVLKCILDCKKPSDDTKASPKKDKSVVKEEKMDVGDVDQSWKDFERFQSMTEREKQEELKGEKADLIPAKKLKGDETFMRPGGQSLLTMWNNRIKTIHNKRHEEFAGREENDGLTAELYIDLGLTDNKREATPPVTGQQNISKRPPLIPSK